MRLQLQIAQEYSMAGYVNSGHLRVLLGQGGINTLTPTVGYHRDLVVGRQDASDVLHIGEGFTGVTVAGSQFGDGTVADGWKVRLSSTVTWTFKPASISGGRDVILVEKRDVAFSNLTESSADRIIDLAQTSAPF